MAGAPSCVLGCEPGSISGDPVRALSFSEDEGELCRVGGLGGGLATCPSCLFVCLSGLCVSVLHGMLLRYQIGAVGLSQQVQLAPWPQHGGHPMGTPPGQLGGGWGGNGGSQRLLHRLVPLPGAAGLDGDISGGDDVPGALEDNTEMTPVAKEHMEAQKVGVGGALGCAAPKPCP